MRVLELLSISTIKIHNLDLILVLYEVLIHSTLLNLVLVVILLTLKLLFPVLRKMETVLEVQVVLEFLELMKTVLLLLVVHYQLELVTVGKLKEVVQVSQLLPSHLNDLKLPLGNFPRGILYT